MVNHRGVIIDVVHAGTAVHERLETHHRSKEGQARLRSTAARSASRSGLATFSALDRYQSCSQRVSIYEHKHEMASKVVGHTRHKTHLESFEHCLVLEGQGHMVCSTFSAGLASRIFPPLPPICRNIASEALQPCKDGLHMLIRLLHRIVDRSLVTTLFIILIVCNGRDSHHRSASTS